MAKTSLVWFFCVLFVYSVEAANFRLATIYGSHMVLQMEPKSAHIWGYGEAGAEVTLTEDGVEINKTIVQADETWSLRLPPTPEGGPHEFTFKHLNSTGATAEVVASDILFGDIWFCSGEQNMEFFMISLLNATEEIALAVTYNNIRLLQVSHDKSTEVKPEPFLEHPWSLLSNETIEWFSAVCLLYAEQLSDALDGRPIGVVEAAWTFNPLQSFVSANVTSTCQLPNSTLNSDNSAHNVYHNAEIYPLFKLAIRGAIWSQGETNFNMSMDKFTCATSEMARDWRNSFIDGTVPATGGAFLFGIVQLGANASADSMDVNKVRLAQSTLLDPLNFPDIAIPESFTVVTYDLVNTDESETDLWDWMYPDKRTVATRLANAALELLKPETLKTASGPKFTLETMSYDSTTAIAMFTFDTDVTFYAESGFGYGTSLDDLIDTKIINTRERSFTVYIDPSATLFVFGHRCKPCTYLNCSVYSNDEAHLPASVVMLPWNSSSDLTPALILVFISYLIITYL